MRLPTRVIDAPMLQVGNGTAGDLGGATTVTVTNAGTLALDLADGSTFATNVTLNDGSNTALKAIQTGTTTITGAISGNGVFDQNGTGTTILSTARRAGCPTTKRSAKRCASK